MTVQGISIINKILKTMSWEFLFRDISLNDWKNNAEYKIINNWVNRIIRYDTGTTFYLPL